MLPSSLGAKRRARQIGVETDPLALDGSRCEGRVASVEADAHGLPSFDIAPVVVALSATHTANFFMSLLTHGGSS
ncbi:hypothetical protein P3T43_004459 [Paraburkholderia sp. GAS41]|jgi:hypothetical protein|uniref:hypothetical protein n=1 Tax=Paraburkholderia sp. GAS41 TaxID=3035134 RepID=UPI003D1E8D25